jgi:hypothetical protein
MPILLPSSPPVWNPKECVLVMLLRHAIQKVEELRNKNRKNEKRRNSVNYIHSIEMWRDDTRIALKKKF